MGSGTDHQSSIPHIDTVNMRCGTEHQFLLRKLVVRSLVVCFEPHEERGDRSSPVVSCYIIVHLWRELHYFCCNFTSKIDGLPFQLPDFVILEKYKKISISIVTELPMPQKSSETYLISMFRTFLNVNRKVLSAQS